MADTTITLDSISRDAYNNAEALLINVVRQFYPTLDLRAGTVLRDWLIRPAATVTAANIERMAELQSLISINTIQASTTATDADYDAVLANFGVTRSPGMLATGIVQVRVSEARTFVLATGTAFNTATGLSFQTQDLYTVTQNANPLTGELPLLRATDGSYYYFMLPVTAAAVGTAYNVAQGTSFTTASSIYGFIASSAYAAFAGGTNAETGPIAVARLPAAIAYRALESRLSIEAKLRNEFSVIQVLSAQGFGDSAQIRDQHNPMGFAVGSRVDIYPRTFQSPNVVVLQKTGQKTGANTYTITIDRLDAPGYYAIRSIAEPESTLAPTFQLGSMQVVGSYAYVETRSADGVQNTFHDIDPANAVVESAYTIYQKATVVITGVPMATATHDFKIELYTAPQLLDIQTYVDRDDVRNLEADQLVRCPLICMVQLNVTAYYKATAPVDAQALRLELFNYINSRSFVQRLSRSELANVLLSNGVTRLDLTNGMVLQGLVRAADGTLYVLQGDTLDLTVVNAPKQLFTANTTVFAAEESGIFIQLVAE